MQWVPHPALGSGQWRPAPSDVGETIETALSLLANASYQMSAMWWSKILEEYNRELLTFAAAKDCDWASGAPQLQLSKGGIRFSTAAADAEESQRQAAGFATSPTSREAIRVSSGGIQLTLIQAITPKGSLSQGKRLPRRNEHNMHTQCEQSFNISNAILCTVRGKILEG